MSEYYFQLILKTRAEMFFIEALGSREESEIHRGKFSLHW